MADATMVSLTSCQIRDRTSNFVQREHDRNLERRKTLIVGV